MADETAAQQGQAQVPRVRDQQYREIYANNTNIGMGPFDVSFTFQKTTEISPGQLGLVDQAVVTVSPQHFKAFVRSANEALAAYEQAFGVLTISEQDTAPTRNAAQITQMLRAAQEAAKPNPSSTELPPPPKQSRGEKPPR